MITYGYPQMGMGSLIWSSKNAGQRVGEKAVMAKNQSKTDYTYNNKGQLTSYTDYRWDDEKNAYEVSTQERYYYNSSMLSQNREASTENGLKLYPNPTNDVLQYSFVSGGKATWRVVVTNSTGQVVYRGSVNAEGATHQTINTANFAVGVYELTLTAQGQATMTKEFLKR